MNYFLSVNVYINFVISFFFACFVLPYLWKKGAVACAFVDIATAAYAHTDSNILKSHCIIQSVLLNLMIKVNK